MLLFLLLSPLCRIFYNIVPEANHISKACNVATVLWLQIVVLPTLNILFFDIGTSCITLRGAQWCPMVPNMAGLCSLLLLLLSVFILLVLAAAAAVVGLIVT
jgi:hypothetical protein